MSREDNVRFNFMCSLLSEYVKTYFKLPTSTTVFKDENLGYWFRNQIAANKNGKLSGERKFMISNAFCRWNGSSDEVLSEMLNVFYHEWKCKIKPSVEGLPVDAILSDYNLIHAVQNDIYSMQDLVNCSDKELSKYGITREDVLSTMMPWIHVDYIKLVYAIIGGDHLKDADKALEEALYCTLSNSPKEMAEKIDSVLLTLNEREQFVINERFFNHKTLVEASSMLSISSCRVREIEVKALRKLRHPSRMRKFIARDRIEAILFRSGISHEQAIILFDNGVISKEHENLIKKWKKELTVKDDSTNNNITVNSEIDALNLSVRAFNCIKRKGIYTVGELINIMKFPTEVEKIRNFGRMTANEVYDTLINLFPEETELINAKKIFK